MKNSITTVFAIFAILILNSCKSATEVETQNLVDFENINLLVLPPIADNATIAEHLGRSATINLTTELAADVRYGNDIPKLKTALAKSNLIADGQINLDEISRIGNSVNAQEVLCLRITASNPYPPQSMTVLVIHRTIDKTKYRQKTGALTINLQDPEHKKEFAAFVGGEIKSPLKDKFTKKTNINAETGLLSNEQFAAFVGYKIAKYVQNVKKY